MSYLTRHAGRRPASTRSARHAARVDERLLLNLPGFYCAAYVHVFVEDTSRRKPRGRGLPSPRLKLQIADCVHEANLEFSVESPGLRDNSLHKIGTLIGALERFRTGLGAEADLRADRERDVPTDRTEVRR